MFEGLSKLTTAIHKGMSVGAADALATMNGLADGPTSGRPADEKAQDIDKYIIEVPCMNCGAKSNIWAPRFQEFAESHDSFPCPACNSVLSMAQYSNGLDSLMQALPEVTQVVQDEAPKSLEDMVANRVMKGLDRFPSKEESEYNKRIMTAKSMEDEAKTRSIYGDPETREAEKAGVLREWERIHQDQKSGLNDDDVWSNHLDRIAQLANACSSPKQAAIRASHYELEGLTTASGIFQDRAETLQSGGEGLTKSIKDLSRMAIGGSWLRKATDTESATQREDYSGLIDDFILDLMDKDMPLEDIEYYTNLVGAMMLTPSGGVIEKSWKWKRKDGSWWMTDPEGGKPVPYRPGMTLSQFREQQQNARNKKMEAGQDVEPNKGNPEESYAKLPEDQQKMVTEAINMLKSPSGIEKMLENAHSRIIKVNYLGVNKIPEDMKNRADFKEQNAEVGRLAGIAKTYLSRAINAEDGTPEKRFWTAAAFTITKEAEHAALTRMLLTSPYFTTGEGKIPDFRGNIDTFVCHQALKWMQKDKETGKYTTDQVKARAEKRSQKILNQMTNPIKALSRAQAYEAMNMMPQAQKFFDLHKQLSSMTEEQLKSRWTNYLAATKTEREELKRRLMARRDERLKKKGEKAAAKAEGKAGGKKAPKEVVESVQPLNTIPINSKEDVENLFAQYAPAANDEKKAESKPAAASSGPGLADLNRLRGMSGDERDAEVARMAPKKAETAPKKEEPAPVAEPVKPKEPTKQEPKTDMTYVPDTNDPKTPEPKNKPTKTAKDVNMNALKALIDGKANYHDFDIDALNAIRKLATQKKNILPAGSFDDLFDDATAEIKRQNRGVFGGDPKKKPEPAKKDEVKPVRPKVEDLPEGTKQPTKAPAPKQEAPKKAEPKAEPKKEDTKKDEPKSEAPKTQAPKDAPVGDPDYDMLQNIIKPGNGPRIMKFMEDDELDDIQTAAGKYYDDGHLNLKQYQAVVDGAKAEQQRRGQ